MEHLKVEKIGSMSFINYNNYNSEWQRFAFWKDHVLETSDQEITNIDNIMMRRSKVTKWILIIGHIFISNFIKLFHCINI